MSVVYLDSVFLLNALMDYLLLLSTARLAGLSLCRRRYFVGALFGGVYAAALFLPGATALSAPSVKLAAGVVMALIAYGGEERLLRLTILFFALACGMAGCVLGMGLLAGHGVPMLNGILYTDVDGKILLISSMAAYAILKLVFRASAQKGIHGRLLPVRISLAGRVSELTALQDTGNALREPITGSPVLVLGPSAWSHTIPASLKRQLTSQTLRHPTGILPFLVRQVPELHPCLLPYRAVGISEGLLLALRSTWVEIGGKRYPNLLLACSPNDLGDGYSALWGGELEIGGNNEREVEKTSAETGTASGRGGSLHWRQRHTPAAAVQSAGSGSVEPTSGRKRTKGADRT